MSNNNRLPQGRHQGLKKLSSLTTTMSKAIQLLPSKKQFPLKKNKRSSLVETTAHRHSPRHPTRQMKASNRWCACTPRRAKCLEFLGPNWLKSWTHPLPQAIKTSIMNRAKATIETNGWMPKVLMSINWLRMKRLSASDSQMLSAWIKLSSNS